MSQTVIKQLNKLEEDTKNRIMKELQILKEDPYHKRSGADIKKLQGFANPTLFRLRVGDFRAVYTIRDEIVKVTDIFPRKKGYKWL